MSLALLSLIILLLAILTLTKLRLVHSSWLASKRAYWVVTASILAAIITPTFDPMNMIILTLGLIAVYELGIWLTRLFLKSNE